MAESEFAIASTEAGLSAPILRAIAEVKQTFGDSVSVTDKNKSLIKFGDSPNIDNTARKTLWEGTAINDEPPLFGDPSLGNVLDTIVSEGADTQTLTVEGHTKSGDDLTFVTQQVTLTGTTEKALDTPLHDCTRIFNASSTDLTGPVYVFDNTDGSASGIPNDPTDVGQYIPAGANQTQSAFTAISSQDYFFITGFVLNADRQSGSAQVDVEFQRRSTTGVWLPSGARFTLSTPSAPHISDVPPSPVLIIPKNSYIRLTARSDSASDARVSGTFFGYLAKVM